jgi:hypothetical protein
VRSRRGSAQPCASLDESSASIVATRDHAFHHVVEKGDFRLGILVFVDFGAQAMAVELVQQLRLQRAFHLVLVKRLHGSEPGGGAGFGLGSHIPSLVSIERA